MKNASRRSRSLHAYALACIGVAAIGSAAAEPLQADETELREQLTAFGAAFCEGDIKSVEGMIAPDYLHVNGTGTAYSRDEWLGWYATRADAIARGDHRCDAYDLSDVTIQIDGSAAYIAATVEVRGVNEGDTFKRRWRMTNIWRRAGDDWQRAGFHDVEITE